MLQVLISIFLLVSLCFQRVLAGQEKLALHSQQLYQSVQRAGAKCAIEGRFYIRFGEEHMEGWRQLHKLHTSDEYIDEDYLSCLSDVLCQHKSPRDIDQARRVYVDARKTCSEGLNEKVSEIRLNKEADPVFESNGLQSLDSGSISATNTTAKLVTLTAENLIYLLAGALLGAVGGTYIVLKSQGSELSKFSRVRRPEL